MEPLPPVWVVNLKESIKRRAYIAIHLTELKLDFQIMEAVNGYALTDDELTTYYSPQQAVAVMNRTLSLGEIGCTLSHLRLYQRMIDTGLEEVLIIEDDVHFSPSLIKLLHLREHFPPGWELIKFSHSGRNHISLRDKKPIYEQYNFIRFANVAFSCQCYLIRQSAAHKLLATGYPICLPLDHLNGGEIKTGINLFGINPCCAWSVPAPIRETTMPDRKNLQHSYQHQRFKKKVKRYFKNHIFIHYKRLFKRYIL